ncbi:hypothetical protein NECAME_10716, partial [Necator americanus]
MYIALSVGDLINGVSLLTAGIFRNLLLFQGQFFVKFTNMECLLHSPWAILFLFA